MQTPYEMIYNRAPYLAQLTDNNGELAQIFIKIVQALYLFITDKKYDPAGITIEQSCNEYGLILKITGRQRGASYSRDFYTKRFQDYAKIIKALKGMISIFTTVHRYCQNRTGINAILTRDGNKIVISGSRRSVYA